jgi:hypothetical protein
MVEYIKNYILEVQRQNLYYVKYVRAVLSELDRLDPRDFEPKYQHDFVRIRVGLDFLTTHAGPTQSATSKNQVDGQFSQLLTVLDHYRGEGSRAITRQFLFITDRDLQSIIDRDYAELTLKLFPSGAWKSSVIMAGSILEAILFDRLADKKWNSAALLSPKVPKYKGADLPMDDWNLANLIDISIDIKLLPKDPANTIHQVLRDFRNFVHPKKEIRAAHPCTDAEAMLALGALNSVCNYFDKNP